MTVSVKKGKLEKCYLHLEEIPEKLEAKLNAWLHDGTWMRRFWMIFTIDQIIFGKDVEIFACYARCRRTIDRKPPRYTAKVFFGDSLAGAKAQFDYWWAGQKTQPEIYAQLESEIPPSEAFAGLAVITIIYY